MYRSLALAFLLGDTVTLFCRYDIRRSLHREGEYGRALRRVDFEERSLLCLTTMAKKAAG
jgi:hypothetical protein